MHEKCSSSLIIKNIQIRKAVRQQSYANNGALPKKLELSNLVGMQ